MSDLQVPAAKIHFQEEEKEEILKEIKGVLDSGWLTLGKHNKDFEEKFSSFVGTKRAIAVNSGTSALEIPLRCLDVRGSSVVVPTNTFVATAFAAMAAGAKVNFADVDESLCVNLETVKQAVTDDTKGVVVVHIGGTVCPEIKEIKKFCDEKGLFLVEDAAHAHGSSLDGQMAGSFGVAAGFSFYPTKVMTSGEGGMITTSSEKIADRALVFRDQGKMGFGRNLHSELGYNWRMSEIHAILGLSQFKHLQGFIDGRRKAAGLYDECLKDVPGIKLMKIPSNIKSNYYKYSVFLDDGSRRAEIKKNMKENFKVSLSGEVYEMPCHLQPTFRQEYGFKGGEFPKAEDLCARHICLPVYANMSEEEVRHVCDSLRKVMS